MKPTRRPRKVPELGVRIPVHVDADGGLDQMHPLFAVALALVDARAVVPLVVATSACPDWRVGDEAVLLTDTRLAPKSGGWVLEPAAPEQKGRSR